MQETDALYTLDSSIKAFESTVVAVEGDEIALQHSAFYPGGGGQPADQGTFRVGGKSWQVAAIRKENGVIWHKIAGETPPSVGQVVLGELDWERRRLLMRTHTALHILSAIAYTDYGASVTGGNMEPGEGRLDFEITNWTPNIAEEIVQKANHEVEKDREIRVYSLPREEALQLPDLVRTKTNLVPPTVTHIRIVEIVGLDRQADGGTHVGFTAEVGTILLRGTRSKGANNKRIMIGLAA
jgi:misacylated tRNA(Ala) deacylase